MFKSLLLGNSTHLHLFIFYCLLLLWLHRANGSYFSRRFPERSSRVPCEDPPALENGFSMAKRRNMLLQHFCNHGFKLIGDRRTQCNHGKWFGERPICAKPGCTIPLEVPQFGRLQFVDHYHISIYCTDGFDLLGNRYAYCNGSDWDRPIGRCTRQTNTVKHECDFESSDACGWVMEVSESFKWRRAMASNVFTSFNTGPRHDHTTMTASGGHYMLMESFGITPTPAALTSPIYERELSLKTSCCFQFYYFMHGAGVGNLNVYVKPVSKMLTEVIADKNTYVKFTKSGNQNNLWTEAHFNIDDMEDDFQIVFVADGAKNHLSDIAIDDVKIMTGTECKALDNHDEEPDDSAEYETTTTEESLYDTLSCAARCGEETNFGIMREATRLIGLCSCHDTCILDNDCCPDYIKVCLDPINDDQFFTTATSTNATTTNTPKIIATPTITLTPSTNITTAKAATPSTTTKATTTTSTTTTTRTTTTTTTRKPTTASTSTTKTTTSTTRKPTTAKSTTTTNPQPTTKRTTTKTATTKRATTQPTTTKSPTTITTTTTTSPKITTTKSPTTTLNPPTTRMSTTKRSTILTPTNISNNTKPLLEVTTGAAIERKKISVDDVAVPQTKTNETQTNATKPKQTWEWHPKPESNPRESIVLFLVFGLVLIVIIAAAVYRQRTSLKIIWVKKILKKEQNHVGTDDSNSIIANFQHEEATQNASSSTSGATTTNRLKLSLPSRKKSKADKRGSSGEQSLCSEYENDDDIPLL